MVSSQTFDRFEGDRPILLVFAPSAEDDRFDGQLLCINDYREGFEERDVVIATVFGKGDSTVAGEPLPRPDAESLRLRYGVGDEDFLAVLIGKEGHEVTRWESPAPPDVLLRAVDRAASTPAP